MIYDFNSISSHPILKDSKGVYCIESEKGVQYIGSTCVSFNNRWRSHLCALKNNKHHSKYMQNCYNKHGIEYFKLSILYFGNAKDDILKCEQHYIDTLKPEFNTAPIAGSVAGMKQSEETIENNRAFRRREALTNDKGVRFNEYGKYEVNTRLKNHTFNLAGFSTEEEARLRQKEIRDYFWSDEFENKNLIDQDEEVELFKLQHKVKIKTERKTSGAVFDSRLNKYRARLYVEGRLINFGSFISKEDAEKAYLKGRSIFVSEEFLLLSKKDKEKFIKDFRFNHTDNRNKSGHKYIKQIGYKFRFNTKTFHTLDEAISYRDTYLENLKADAQY